MQKGGNWNYYLTHVSQVDQNLDVILQNVTPRINSLHIKRNMPSCHTMQEAKEGQAYKSHAVGTAWPQPQTAGGEEAAATCPVPPPTEAVPKASQSAPGNTTSLASCSDFLWDHLAV